MATLFNITVPSNAVTLNAKRSGQITFTVANTTGRSLGVIFRVVPSDPNIQSWFQLGEDATSRLDPHQTVQYTVTVTIPDNAAAKDYDFHLVVAEDTNPDDNFTNSPDVRVTAPALAAPPANKPFPWWIIAVIIAVLVVIVIIVVAVVSNNNRANANATATGQFFATQTASAVFATQTELARPTTAPTPRPPATISVTNGSTSFVIFTVTYVVNGNLQSQTSGTLATFAKLSVTIPGDATNVSVQIQNNTGFGMRNSCDAFTMSVAKNASYSVSGTNALVTSCSQP